VKTSTDHARPQAGRALLLGGALALVVAAACSSGDGDGERALTESLDSASSQSESESATESQGGDQQATGDQAGGGSPSGEVLGTTRAEVPGGSDDQTVPVRVDLTRLERNGELVTIGLLVTNEAEEPTDGSEPITFGRGSLFVDGGVNAGYDASGIGLIDGEGQMLYLPAYDSEGICMCSDWYSDESIPPGGAATIEATIGGVPEDVEEVDVRVPNFPAISGVAIQ
jgi:hypothetical protein